MIWVGTIICLQFESIYISDEFRAIRRLQLKDLDIRKLLNAIWKSDASFRLFLNALWNGLIKYGDLDYLFQIWDFTECFHKIEQIKWKTWISSVARKNNYEKNVLCKVCIQIYSLYNCLKLFRNTFLINKNGLMQ